MDNGRQRYGSSYIKRLNQVGDTIVEVLVSTAIISLILAGAYVTSRTSLAGTRASEERGEALSIAQGQVEQLRPIGHGLPPSVSSQPFCIAEGASGGTSLNGPLPASADDDNFSTYPDGCTFGSGVPYHVAIEFNELSKLFTVHVRWDHVGGGGKDEVILVYRLPNAGSIGYAALGDCTDPLIKCESTDYPENQQPAYFWGVTKWNVTDTHGKAVKSCDLDWGDGQPHTTSPCAPDVLTGYQHCYPIPPGANVFTPATYDITFTVLYEDGSQGKWTDAYTVPWGPVTSYPPYWLDCGKLET